MFINRITGRIKIGDNVFCDWCGEDWTDRTEQGGFMFGSKAACPDCAPTIRASAREHGEEHFIKSECPEDDAFSDWVREMRGPGAEVIVAEFDFKKDD